jgi:hypothetical protein
MVMSWSRLSDLAFLSIVTKVVSSLGSTSQWRRRPTVLSFGLEEISLRAERRVNSLSHLTEFILKDGALTLISALRLISSRPKLRTVGRLLHWDVEPSELTTFVTILRKAKSLNLLQDITIV